MQGDEYDYGLATGGGMKRADEFTQVVVERADVHQQGGAAGFGGNVVDDLPCAHGVVLRVEREKAAECDVALLGVADNAVGDAGGLSDVGAGFGGVFRLLEEFGEAVAGQGDELDLGFAGGFGGAVEFVAPCGGGGV